MQIKFKLPPVMRDGNSFDYDMDVIDAGLVDGAATNEEVKSAACLAHFVMQTLPASSSDYHDSDFLVFKVDDPKAMMTSCLSANVFEAPTTAGNADNILMTVNGKFRLRVYIKGTHSPYKKNVNYADTNDDAFMVKPFKATMVYNTETQAMTQAQLYNTDMGDLTMETEADWNAAATVMNHDCSATAPFVTYQDDTCVSVQFESLADMTAYKLQVTRIRIIKGSDVTAANAVKFDSLSTVDGTKLTKQDTTTWAAETALEACKAASGATPSTCAVEGKFEMPTKTHWEAKNLKSCSDCKIVLDLKLIAARRRLSENGARRLSEDSSKRVVVDLKMARKSEGNNVKASSAVRPAGAAAAVATAAAAGAALLA